MDALAVQLHELMTQAEQLSVLAGASQHTDAEFARKELQQLQQRREVLVSILDELMNPAISSNTPAAGGIDISNTSLNSNEDSCK